MANLDKTIALFEEFQQQSNKSSVDVDRCKALLTDLKIALTLLAIPLPGSKDLELPHTQKRLSLAREILEQAVLFSVKIKDIPAFERFFAQVKPYYYDYAKSLPPSQKQFCILGLNLLRLLAQNCNAEFHAELELLPLENHQNVHIRHPIMIEQYIMEGSYPKVRSARADVPHELYLSFMDILMDTIRDEVADCSERAFHSLPLSEIQKLLQFQDPRELKEFVNKRSWDLNGSVVTFHKTETAKTEIPSMQLIRETLTYAKELERIV